MHQHPRGSPVTASPANSPRTNPTRTNNPRDQEQAHSRRGSNAGASTERGSTEGFDVGLQSQQSSSQGKEAKAKLNQIIQVCSAPTSHAIHDTCADHRLLLELSHQGGSYNHTIEGTFTSCVYPRLGDKKGKQVGQ